MLNCDEEIHRALVHPIRRNIISYLQERQYASFTELRNYVGIRDHGKLGFHINALGNLIRSNRSRKKYLLTRRGRLAAELIWKTRFNLIEIIHFTEEVSAKIHGVLDKDEILRVIKEEFEKSKRYDVGIFFLTGDGSKLRVAETSEAGRKFRVVEKAAGLQLEHFRIDLNKSSIFSQVVRGGKTIQVKVIEITNELLQRPLADLMSKIMGYEKKNTILTPLHQYGEIVGAIAVSSTNLTDYFIPSVRNLAQHISKALEQADQHAKFKMLNEELIRFLEELVEERTGKLRESEERLRSFMESAIDGFYLFDSELNLVEINKTALERSDLKKEDVIGKNILDLSSDVKKSGRYDKYKEVIKTGEHFFVDDVALHPKYGDRNIALKAFKVGDGLGMITTDITERKNLEEKLRQSEKNFRALAGNSMAGILIASGEGSTVYVNKRAAEITGYSVAELLKTSIKDLVHHDEFEKVMGRYRKRLEGRPILQQYETRIIRKEGESVPIELAATKTIWQGKPADLIVFRDITERKLMEKVLKENYGVEKATLEAILPLHRNKPGRASEVPV